jgi:hypothetical protein
MGVQPKPLIRGYRRVDTIKFGRPMEEVLASLGSDPYTTIHAEDGVEYQVPTESFLRGAYDRS